MADLTRVLGGPWSPPVEVSPLPIDVQFRRAIEDAGLDSPDELILDGRIHRFRSGSSRKSLDRSGWYVGHLDGIPCLTFGCWRANLTQTVKADTGKKRWTPAEEMAHIARVNAAKKLRDEELERDRSVAASTVETIWRDGAQASPDHPYLKRKGVQPHGARVTGDGRLMVPLFSEDGELSSLQYISEDGGKLYHSGGQTGGRFWIIGTLDQPGILYVAEGFATAATIHEVTGRPCVVAYSASNLIPVTGSLLEIYPGQKIVIVADNDKSGVGQRHAEQACAKYGVSYVMPPIEGDANDYAQAGHNLSLLLNPVQESWLIPADDYCKQPAPIKWLIKGWLQSDALIMIHGPSGGGKTFVVLDWCLRLASGMTEWAGHRVKPAKVVYLAGEGHHGLRARIAAWKQHHQAGNLQMWLSRSGCDLNTPEGYLSTMTALKQLPELPDLVVIDTLHRFLNGDENSAQDAKTMLDACAQLMREFNCSVLLVHHTGVSEEAQHRARGSSAWRGALDIEVSIIPAKDEAPMQIVQRKSKDSEITQDIFARLQTVEINGWIDEDGEQVTSAIIEIVDKPLSDKSDNKLSKHKKLFTNAWEKCGMETRAEQPYISRAAFVQYLIDNLDFTENSANKYVQPSANGKPIAELVLGKVLQAHEHGWMVIDQELASAMLLSASRK